MQRQEFSKGPKPTRRARSTVQFDGNAGIFAYRYVAIADELYPEIMTAQTNHSLSIARVENGRQAPECL
ncbi:hypothetical protein GCM10007853_17390 [Algimonas ampicilliniresistens]|uniref:Uncharacterized protein n=1 Tax=Algimonas ampicilliniresistens TaxID=1298735 RepID=A0ABQ5V8X0_9PROT|nr:hypothetical protein GCM10007853_17390 [Algimonas ampicilliniresistens]